MKKDNTAKWPPILTVITGFVIVFFIAASLVPPCGPGSEWSAFLCTLIYSVAIFIFRFRIKVSRYTALTLAIISFLMLAECLYTKREFGIKIRKKALELQSQRTTDGTNN